MDKGCGIVGLMPTARMLKEHLLYFDSAAEVVDTCDIVRHEVDCQLYGSTFRTHCNDPLTEVFIALSVPTDYRRYIEQRLFNAVEQLLTATIGAPQWNHTYVVEWISHGAGLIRWWPDPPVRLPQPSEAQSNWGAP